MFKGTIKFLFRWYENFTPDMIDLLLWALTKMTDKAATIHYSTLNLFLAAGRVVKLPTIEYMRDEPGHTITSLWDFMKVVNPKRAACAGFADALMEGGCAENCMDIP
jgi:hypothetical protein